MVYACFLFVTNSFSPNQKWVLTSSDDRTARLWDFSGIKNSRSASSSEPKCHILEGHGPHVFTAAFHPEGTFVLKIEY